MDWATGNLREIWSTPWVEPVVTAAAVVCGGLVGWEREKREKPAGLRTLVLITTGAALFTQMSLIAGGGRGDPMRLAAQIVTGVGFLGAGAILRDKGRAMISGLTTAATIWLAAAVGVVVGAGY